MTAEANAYSAELLASGLEYGAKFVPQSQSRNAGREPCLNWRVTLQRGGCTLTTNYMQGVGHLPNYAHHVARRVYYADAVIEACETGRSRLIPYASGHGGVAPRSRGKVIAPPALADVLFCLVIDSIVLDYADFEEWADTCGYATDSRAAEKIYRGCLEMALKLRQIVDLESASEAFRDY